jgi:transcriptional regulator with XRE-family HTH domain
VASESGTERAGEDIGAWIRRQLTRRDWKAADLSRRMGVSPGRISEWINSERRPSPASCVKLADAFGAELDDVLALAGHRIAAEPLQPDDPKTRVIALIRRVRLTPDRAAGLEATLQAWLALDHNGNGV